MSVKTTVNTDFEIQLNGEEIIEKNCKKLAENIKKSAPKKTKEYANGITYRIDSGTGYVYNKGSHWSLGHILEFGTVKQRPQPHYRTNYNKQKSEIINDFRNIKIEIE